MNRRLPLLIVSALLALVFTGTYQLRGSARNTGYPSCPGSDWPTVYWPACMGIRLRTGPALSGNLTPILSNVTITDGVLHARAIDSDPFLLCRDASIGATPTST